MELSIVSYNVRGLSTQESKTHLWTFLRDTHFNICFLQEHKVCNHIKLHWLGKSIWQEGHFYFIAVQDEVHATQSDAVSAGHWGLIIGVAPTLQQFITHPHSLTCGRALFVHLDGLVNGKVNGPISLLNIYSSHTTVECIQLWHTILDIIDHSWTSWIMASDWNFSEATSDQVGGTPKDLSIEEVKVWATFKSTLGISDIYYPHRDLLTYTWDNHHLFSHCQHTYPHSQTTRPILLGKWNYTRFPTSSPPYSWFSSVLRSPPNQVDPSSR